MHCGGQPQASTQAEGQRYPVRLSDETKLEPPLFLTAHRGPLLCRKCSPGAWGQGSGDTGAWNADGCLREQRFRSPRFAPH